MIHNLINKIKRLIHPLYKYEIEWGCVDGRENRYVSNTLEGIRKLITDDTQLHDWEKRILKYGYDDMFIDDITTFRITIDNGFGILWYKYKLIF